MAAYLDTSVLASLFVVDAHSAQAVAWLRRYGPAISFSDWTLTEFTSAIATVSRAGRLPAAMLTAAEQGVDRWVARRGGALAVTPDDVRVARTMMRSTGEPLRAADALHLAIIRRTGCSLATFDNAMRRAATDLALPVEDL